MNIFNAKKYEDKVKSIITVSKIYSIDEISEIANINRTDCIKLIEKLIKRAGNLELGYHVFKNAHINYQTDEIVLDESKSVGLTDKLGSFVDRFLPKKTEEKSDWKCSYCGSMNKANAYECSKCSASKE